MTKKCYTITCLTNLHVGSGDVNFNIVDKEVEKDPVTGYPMIHSSGIKGALRDAYQGEEAAEIFGMPGERDKLAQAGICKFFNAYLLCRPLRTAGSRPSIPVTTVQAINDYIELTTAFGFDPGMEPLPELTFGENLFLSTQEDLKVEGEKTGPLELDESRTDALKKLLGGEFAVAKSFDGFDLPVIARNNLTTDNGNLWYEEYVPRGSRFYMVLLAPEESGLIKTVVPDTPVQLGGNASVGYGYCKFEAVME